MNSKVLLVDDDPSIRESLGRALRSEDYDVLPAANGQEALQTLCRTVIDLVLLDINMPVINGWETLDQIFELNPFLPVIIITARPNQQKLAEKSGVMALLEKPLVLPMLLQLMKRALAEPLEARRERAAQRQAHAHAHSISQPSTGGSPSQP